MHVRNTAKKTQNSLRMWCCQVAGLRDSFQLWKENISPPHPAGPRRKASGCPRAVGEATDSTGSLTCPGKVQGAEVLGCGPPWRLWSREGGTPGGPQLRPGGKCHLPPGLRSCRNTLLPPPTESARQPRRSESRVWLTDSAPRKVSSQEQGHAWLTFRSLAPNRC